MFLRASVCTSKLSRQLAIASKIPAKMHLFKQAQSTPIINSVCSFRTTAVRLTKETPHDHAKLWVVEKAVAAMMIPLVPIGLMLPNKICDTFLAILISAHTYWGLQAMVVEYIRVILFGPFIPKLAMAGVYLASVFIMGGLYYLVFNDIGLSRAFWKIWKNIRKQKTCPIKKV